MPQFRGSLQSLGKRVDHEYQYSCPSDSSDPGQSTSLRSPLVVPKRSPGRTMNFAAYLPWRTGSVTIWNWSLSGKFWFHWLPDHWLESPVSKSPKKLVGSGAFSATKAADRRTTE